MRKGKGETYVIFGNDEEAHRATRRQKAEKMRRVKSAVKIANSLDENENFET